jgi:hypothetical protein
MLNFLYHAFTPLLDLFWLIICSMLTCLAVITRVRVVAVKPKQVNISNKKIILIGLLISFDITMYLLVDSLVLPSFFKVVGSLVIFGGLLYFIGSSMTEQKK